VLPARLSVGNIKGLLGASMVRGARSGSSFAPYVRRVRLEQTGPHPPKGEGRAEDDGGAEGVAQKARTAPEEQACRATT
jgi:hypothetical protein